MEFVYNKKLNLKISRIGFGGIPIQNSSVKNAKDVIDELIRSNVNYIDSARGYKESEKIIGEAIKGRRSSFILATKSMARTYEAMKKDIEVSLGNFQTDYIDIYQLHNPNMEALELCLSDEGAYRALKEAKKEGKIGHIGITNHSLEVLNKAIDTGLFETVMYPFNIVEDQGKEMFDRCKSLGILTIAMKPVAGGAIDNKRLAIKYLLNEDIDVIIPGMKDKNEVIENVNIKKEALYDSELAEVKRIKEDLSGDFCRRCGYCAPCSVGIDIPNCFVFEGYFKKYDLKDWAVERYASLKHHASECIECGMCESRCPYNLKIIEKLKEVRKTFGK